MVSALLSWAWLLISPLINSLPEITLGDGSVPATALEVIQVGLFFLPLNTFRGIFAILLALWVFRVIIVVIKTFWSLLPFA